MWFSFCIVLTVAQFFVTFDFQEGDTHVVSHFRFIDNIDCTKEYTRNKDFVFTNFTNKRASVNCYLNLFEGLDKKSTDSVELNNTSNYSFHCCCKTFCLFISVIGRKFQELKETSLLFTSKEIFTLDRRDKLP